MKVNLDEKSTTILEFLYANRGGSLFREDLYKATKPTQHRTLLRRLDELQEAGLTESVPISFDCGYKIKITDFGIKVASMLKPEDEITT